MIAWRLPLLLLASLLAAPAAAQDQPAPPAVDAPPPLPPGQEPAPPPLPDIPQAKFYFNDAGRPTGPLSLAEIEGRVRSGAIGRTTLVWKAGTPAWAEAQSVAELAVAFRDLPPPIAPAEETKQFLLGTWEVQSPVQGGGSQRTVASYTADGRFSGVSMYDFGTGLPPVTSPIQGTWSVAPAGSKRFTLTLDAGTTRGSHLFSIVDDNTIRNEGDGSVATRTSR